jgi:hypothetical protein
MGILAACPSLLSTQLTIQAGAKPRQRGKIRVSRPFPSRQVSYLSRDPSPKSQSKSAGLIQVSRPDPNSVAIRVQRVDLSQPCLIRVVRHDLSRPLLPPVHSSHDGYRSLVHNLKGVRGYRAIARRRRLGRRRRRLAASQVGRCVAWIQLQQSGAQSARLSTRAAGPRDLLQRRCLRGGSSRSSRFYRDEMEGLRKLVLQCMWFRESTVCVREIFRDIHKT